MKKMTLNQWIVGNHVGTSSKTMWAAITGAVKEGEPETNIMHFRFSVPCDRDDFSRCYRLWKQCELTTADLKKVMKVFPWWAPFIDNWDKLVMMYEGEKPMYKFITKLGDESMRLNGYVEEYPGSWVKRKK